MIDTLFKLYFAAIGLVIAVSVGILAYSEANGDNLRHAYIANHGFNCGNALYNYDWGGTQQGRSYWAAQTAKHCDFDPDSKF